MNPNRQAPPPVKQPYDKTQALSFGVVPFQRRLNLERLDDRPDKSLRALETSLQKAVFLSRLKHLRRF